MIFEKGMRVKVRGDASKSYCGENHKGEIVTINSKEHLEGGNPYYSIKEHIGGIYKSELLPLNSNIKFVKRGIM